MLAYGTIQLSEVVVTTVALWGVREHWALFRRADWYLDELDRSQMRVSRAVRVNMRSGCRNEIAWVHIHAGIAFTWAVFLTMPTFGTQLQFWSLTIVMVGSMIWARHSSRTSERERTHLMATYRTRRHERSAQR